MRFFKYLIILLISFILQVTVFSLKPVAGVKPDLLLVVVVIISLLDGAITGMKVGFGSGLLQDLFITGIPGKYMVIKLLIGGFVGGIENYVYKNNYIIAPIIVFFITIIQEVIIFIIFARGIIGINLLQTMRTVIIPVSIYNGILGLFLYPIFNKIIEIGDKRL